uniref:Hypotheticial protein n=2 Tax=Schistosoma japonicum TaxID=6182 RepID=Q5D8Q8_SCHJA|nr:SJCHGC07069 protein [Schistosoma japonicum]CAX69939.1 hypotheticial protein [Schistosoma japonicum]
MTTLSEGVGVIKTIVEKYLNESSFLKLNTVSQLDDLLNADHLPVDLSQMSLQLAISSAEVSLDNLRFEDDELQRECEELSRRFEQCIARRNADLLEKEATLEEHRLKLKVAKAKLAIYENFTKTKFTINQNSVTAFIFNPDNMVQLTVPETLTGTDICQIMSPSGNNAMELTIAGNEIKQMKSLWSHMKVSSKWKHLIEVNSLAKVSE